MAAGSFDRTSYPVTRWVSPDGDDHDAGTRYAPFRSLDRAQAEVRRFAESAPPGSEIQVLLMEGEYPLAEPLRFDPALFGPDGPRVRFASAGDAVPVISGGVRITGWTLHDPDRNIWQASARGLNSRQLIVGGRRAQRARTTMPDGGLPAGFRPTPVVPQPAKGGEAYTIGGGIDYVPTDLNPAPWRDPMLWKNADQVEAVIQTQWKMIRVPLRKVHPPLGPAPGRIEMAQPAWTNANLVFTKQPDGSLAPGIWSFWQVSWFENHVAFLDTPGEWVLDAAADTIFYMPRAGEDLATVEAILPVVETLVEAHGSEEAPVCNLAFEGLAFRHATWLGPSGDDGYVVDQSGFHLVGSGHRSNVTGHFEHVIRTPGNLSFRHARNIRFERCDFAHLGAVAVDFGTGSQGNRIHGCNFDDIASAAIQIGGIDRIDYFEPSTANHTRDNQVTANRIRRTGRDYSDSAAIYLGFTTNSLVASNSIAETPWSGIALGWGWGLLDPGSFPGVPGATSGQWGVPPSRTVNCGNRILHNHIERFLEQLWDGGAIYCCGWQGNGFDDALRIEGNVLCRKRPAAGGNILYNDGGSRYLIVTGNASFDNPIGAIDLGPKPRPGDPLPYDAAPSVVNGVPYGGDVGGCVTYGDIRYEGNYWAAGLIPVKEALTDAVEELLTLLFTGHAFGTYGPGGFFDICPYSQGHVSYPTNLVFEDNHQIPLGKADVPPSLLAAAGVPDATRGIVASGPAPAGGGASFPPRNPGPSWNVPRVSLPGLFGVQKQYAKEWWYYVGIADAADGKRFGLQLEISRFSLGSLQLGLGITGIGWRDATGRDFYLSAEGVGFGGALRVPPVSDTAFSAHLRPLIEITGRSSDLKRDLHWNLPIFGGSDGWKFDYLPAPSQGAPLGTPGSRYALAVKGRGFVTDATSADTRAASYALDLELTDRRGMVMEGLSGYVGPAMFTDDDIGLASYECAQPVLRIGRGSLTIDGTAHAIAGGTLWLDRQLIAGAPSDTPPSLFAALKGQAPAAKQLYLGDWLGITLDDGLSLALALFWRPSTPQWITGTKVGRPPKQGFGNLYLPVQGHQPQGNGGLALKPRLGPGDDWDFDLNILDPGTPDASPHWTSPASGHSYATAWQIDFAPRVQRLGLPPTLYLRALSENCEIIPGDASGAFFEGAALAFADREGKRRIGQAFVEQMGFN
ncbi:hypothetical protein [Sphingomonas sp.]|uniref:hypothetical protein n=1 Tax=Sphingomonas sp. TaxID=28214 RepID=UPI001B00D929|nr:hypothetical protein [Sphingomonas sp.]MBO9712345.1 hypothetical protein [Sphingomonas sp.]